MKNSILFTLIVFVLTIGNSQNTVTVIGEGIVIATPNQVSVKVRVENEGLDAKLVQQMNNNSVDKVIKSLKLSGVDLKNVKTDYINLSRQHDYKTKKMKFVANQSITILLTKLELYEKVMNRLLEAGVNRIDGVVFSTDKLEDLKSEARKKSVVNAKKKALEYVSVLDQKIGKALIVSEVGVSAPLPRHKMMMIEEASYDDTTSETIAIGNIKIKHSVTITFELL